MKNIVWILLLITALIVSFAEAQEKRVIPLKVARDKCMITVKVGNTEIPNILLDTGFGSDGLMIYNPDLIQSLDLPNAVEAQVGGAGSDDPANARVIESAEFSIGNVKMSNQPIILLQNDMYRGFPSNGIIGYSIFGHYVTAFDYDQKTMTLHPPGKAEIDSSWTEIPLYFKDNTIPWLDIAVVTGQEPPVTLHAYIDFAAGDAIVLLEKPDMKFSLPKETTDVFIGRGLSGDIYGKRGKISKLIIGNHELTQVMASIASAKVRSKQPDGDAILGSGALSRFNLVFDYANKKLYVKPNSHFDDS